MEEPMSGVLHRRTRAVTAGGLVALAALMALNGLSNTPAYGQTRTATATRGAGATRASPATEPSAMLSETVHTLEMRMGHSRVIESPWPVKRISISDPKVVDVQALSPSRVELMAKGLGSTDVLLWSEEEDVWHARVEVEADLDRLQNQLKRLFPGTSLAVTQSGDLILISGSLGQPAQAQQLERYLKATGVKYLDMTRVAGVQQVHLKVRIAEVSRSALRVLSSDFAFSDFTASFAVNNGGSGTFTPATPIGNLDRTLPVSTTVFGSGSLGATTFEYFLQAMEQNHYLRMLAEPNLVALSGQKASFLSGGEIPIPIQQLSGNNTSVSIEYRQFGVQLNFTPTVLGDGRIQLHVLPEVSELTDVGAIQILGTRIPALLTRRAETTLELSSGQTFAMGGLLSHSTDANVSKVPVLGDLPVLGTLFRSVRYQQNDTELVVLVTASLVEPLSTSVGRLPVPGVLHRQPNAWELYIDGRIEGRGAPRIAPAQQEQLKRMQLDQLKGPGGWASYEAQAASHGAAKSEKNEKSEK